jgi:iron complex outermembrane receptor protein
MISSASAVLDGPLTWLSAGEAKLAVGMECRREAFSYQVDRGSDGKFAGQLDRSVASTFGELSLPILGRIATSRTVPRLDLRAAARLERYSDAGTTFNPHLGLQWTPTEALRMRASWGRSFRAPKLFDRDTTRNFSGIASLNDPKSPTGQSVALIRVGNNPDVQEETASTWTVGLDFVPRFVDGRVSLTYYRIAYKDRIVTPSFDAPFAILSREDRWPSIINRHPTPNEVDAACQRSDFVRGSPTCDQALPMVLIDARQNNFATTDMNGLDLELERGWQGPYGSLAINLAANYVLAFTQRDAAGSPSTDLLDTRGNPLALRLRAEAEWAQQRAAGSGFSVAVRLNYTGGYRNTDSVLKPRVSPWTTVDFQLRYALPNSGWLSGVELAANAVNVSNEDPPWIDSEYGYDPENAAPVGRVLSLELRKHW